MVGVYHVRANEFLFEGFYPAALNVVAPPSNPNLPKADFINKTIQKTDSNWKPVGSGYTSSVWQHAADPTTVVKVVGGGTANPLFRNDIHEHRAATLAFINFCVDHGKESKHFPIIHGINVDDEDVLQIRMEHLLPIPDNSEYDLCGTLGEIDEGYTTEDDLTEALEAEGLSRYNSAADIIKSVDMLRYARQKYGKKYDISLTMDLHAGNWLMHDNGTIVAVDPWI